MAEYKAYQLTFFQRFRALRRMHMTLDEYDSDIAVALKVLTGGHTWDTFNQIRADASDIW